MAQRFVDLRTARLYATLRHSALDAFLPRAVNHQWLAGRIGGVALLSG